MTLEQTILDALANFETSNYRTLLEKAAKELEELRDDFTNYAHHVGSCNGVHKNYECCCGYTEAKERWCV